MKQMGLNNNWELGNTGLQYNTLLIFFISLEYFKIQGW